MFTYSLAIHGGAGTLSRVSITSEQEEKYHQTLKVALQAGQHILEEAGSACEAVCAAIRIMEDSPLFNAGHGAVLGHDGKHELEASLMCGKTLQAGAVAGLRHSKNPIDVAHAILNDDRFVYLLSEGAEAFAREHHIEEVPNAYFTTEARLAQLEKIRDSQDILLDHDTEHKFGTVGAVARDLHGDLAAGTSTGGLTNKRYGRVGDSSVIGSGTYAHNASCAVSCTGYGEYFLRTVTAYDIAAQMVYGKKSLAEACQHTVMEKLAELGGEGGLIAIDRAGKIQYSFNSEGMYRGSVGTDLPLTTKIFR